MSETPTKRRRESRTMRLGDAIPDILEYLSRWDLDVVQITAGVLRDVVGRLLRNVCLRKLNHCHWRYMPAHLVRYEVEVRSLVNEVRTLRFEGRFEETAAFFGNANKSATFDAQLYIDVDRPLPPFLLNEVLPSVDVQENVPISFSYGNALPSFSDVKAVIGALNKVPALTLDGVGMRQFLNDTKLVELKAAGIHHLRIEERGETAFDPVPMSANAIIQFLSGGEDSTLYLDPISVDNDVVKDLITACEEGSLAENFRLEFCRSDITPEYMTSVEGIEVDEDDDRTFTVASHHLKFFCNGDCFEVYRGTFFDSR
ncbi:hypothetical protein AAVH_18713 [Aphelenchoides avenae]|nr:hypothetical protein AAVH_18713 [Aphelenchus avenae]